MKTAGTLKMSLDTGLGKTKGELGKVPKYIWFLKQYLFTTEAP